MECSNATSSYIGVMYSDDEMVLGALNPKPQSFNLKQSRKEVLNVPGYSILRSSHMSYRLNSSKRGLYRVESLGPKLLKGDYRGVL